MKKIIQTTITYTYMGKEYTAKLDRPYRLSLRGSERILREILPQVGESKVIVFRVEHLMLVR